MEATTSAHKDLYTCIHSEHFMQQHGTSRLHAIKCGALQAMEIGLATILMGVSGTSTILKFPFQAVHLIFAPSKTLKAIDENMWGFDHFIAFVIHVVKNALGFTSSLILGCIVSPKLNFTVQNYLGNVTDKQIEGFRRAEKMAKTNSSENEEKSSSSSEEDDLDTLNI